MCYCTIKIKKGDFMDNVIIYSLIGILLLVGVIVFTFKSSKPKDVKTKTKKKAEIIDSYKTQLQKALAPLKDDKAARVNKKNEMLKRFSTELSRNIFFDNSEIRGIIAELVKD